MEFVTREVLARCIDSFDARNAFRREFIFRLQVNEHLGYCGNSRSMESSTR